MTLIISITTKYGIILASDSRKTRKNQIQVQRTLSDNVSKLQQINKRVVIGKAGLTSFPDDYGNIQTITEYIDSYKMSTDNILDKSPQQVSNDLYNFLNDRFPWQEHIDQQLELLRRDIESQGGILRNINQNLNYIEFEAEYPGHRIEQGNTLIEPITLLVNGYDINGNAETFQVTVPGGVECKRPKNDYGSTWIGMGDVVSRLILGYDPRIFSIELFKNSLNNYSEQDIRQELSGLEFGFQWADLELQDAIDLAVELVKITEIVSDFADGIRMDDGAIQGVGGPIDVVVITPNYVEWVNKKQLHYPDD